MKTGKPVRILAALTLAACMIWPYFFASAVSDAAEDSAADTVSSTAEDSAADTASSTAEDSAADTVSGAAEDSTADTASSAAEDSMAVIKGPPEGDYHGKTVILHSNDVWGAADGYPRMAWLKGEFERLGAEVILADAGDFTFGPIYADSTGAAAIELMNLTGYDVASLGDYDFNYGYDALRRNLRRAAFPVLCANALENGENICTPNYSYTTKSGLTIGFFGVVTPRTATNITSAQAHSVRILSRQDAYRCVQEQIDILRWNGNVIPGADIVIGLTHVGADDGRNIAGYTSNELYANAKGLDLILDGHSQSVMTRGENGEAIQSCGGQFAYIGVVVIDDASKSIEDRWLTAPEDLKTDQAILEAVEMLEARYREEYGTVFARSEVNLSGESNPGACTEETSLGDLITDAMVWSARQSVQEWNVDENHIVGMTNGAGIRNGIPAGSITKNSISAAFPFSNTISVAYITGAELLEVLEASTWCLPQPSNSYPQTSGIKFTLDERIPYDTGELYPNMRFYRPASIRRVQIESIHGQPFDPHAVYAVVTNNYCAAGNGTFYRLGATQTHIDTVISVEEAIVDYIQQSLGGVVTEAMYGQPRGDHTILS